MIPAELSRRNFLIKAALAGSAIPLMSKEAFASQPKAAADVPKINIFSKHLQFLNYKDMADAAKEIGFDGIDLTVRPKGHVLPERVENDLPLAVEAMKKVGFAPLMMCTAVEDANTPLDKKVLETAAAHGIKYYRMNWYKYNDQKTIPQALSEYRDKMSGLSHLNKKLGLTGCYQNHAGRMVGASMFEIWDILQKADPDHMGAQYDIRHATLEGGLSWQTGYNLIKPNIKTIVLKDFMWDKSSGKWAPKNMPLGEGMVDFKTYFKLLKEHNVQAPICLHLEYPLGGADQGADKITVAPKVVFDAMKRDLQRVKELWLQA
jgi:L-ribulose-5-phosphate 3-epimerase